MFGYANISGASGITGKQEPGAERCRQWTVPVNQLETCAMKATRCERPRNHLDLVETLASLAISVL
jgi:hypothetical protein